MGAGLFGVDGNGNLRLHLDIPNAINDYWYGGVIDRARTANSAREALENEQLINQYGVLVNNARTLGIPFLSYLDTVSDQLDSSDVNTFREWHEAAQKNLKVPPISNQSFTPKTTQKPSREADRAAAAEAGGAKATRTEIAGVGTLGTTDEDNTKRAQAFMDQALGLGDQLKWDFDKNGTVDTKEGIVDGINGHRTQKQSANVQRAIDALEGTDGLKALKKVDITDGLSANELSTLTAPNVAQAIKRQMESGRDS